MEEIKAGDIMIGNYVMFENTTHIVTEISETLVATRWIKGNNKYIHELSDLRPIPLAEEILLKAGAKRLQEGKVAIMLNGPATHLILMKVGTHWYPQIEQTGESVSDGVNTVYLNFIDYAHQAQILFKSLTGNDLKIEV